MKGKHKTTTTKIKTARPLTLTDGDLLNAVRKTELNPIFDLFENELRKASGKTLHIAITVKPGDVKLQYGIQDA